MHERIVRSLATCRQGSTREKLLKRSKTESSGAFSKALDELIESGFVSHYQPIGKKKKDALFRLSDEFTLFDLKFMEPNKEQGSGAWAKLFSKQSYKSWSGFTFETICLKHLPGQEKTFSLQCLQPMASYKTPIALN